LIALAQTGEPVEASLPIGAVECQPKCEHEKRKHKCQQRNEDRNRERVVQRYRPTDHGPQFAVEQKKKENRNGEVQSVVKERKDIFHLRFSSSTEKISSIPVPK